MDDTTCNLLAAAPSVTTGVKTSEDTSLNDTKKYDVLNINFEDDIKVSILDKLANAYRLKDNLFGETFSIASFNQEVEKAISNSLKAVDGIRKLGIDDILKTNIAKDLKIIVRNSKPIAETSIKTTAQPTAFLEEEGNSKVVNLVLDKKLYKAMKQNGVQSVNKKPSRFSEIVKGKTDITITLEDVGAIEDTEPSTPSVALNNSFVSLAAVLRKATTEKDGVVKYASELEIQNKLETDSAVSPEQMLDIIDKINFVPDIVENQKKTGKTYAFTTKDKWVEYKQHEGIPSATSAALGITRLAKNKDLIDGATDHDSCVAVTYRQLNSYIQKEYPEPFRFPPKDGFYYAALEDSDSKAHWVRIYNEVSEVPSATINTYGIGTLATPADIETGAVGAFFITGDLLKAYLQKHFASLYGKITDTNSYVIKYDSGKLSFVKFDDAISQATQNSYGSTTLDQGKQSTLTSTALTPKGAYALIETSYSTRNAKIPNLLELKHREKDDVYARTSTGFAKIGGKERPATTTSYGTVTRAAVSKTLVDIKTKAKDASKHNNVVPKEDIAVMEKALADYYVKLPSAGSQTYLFTKKNGVLDFKPADLQSLSHFKSVFLDDNNQPIKTTYRSAVHVLKATTELDLIKPEDMNYSVNLAQIIGS